MERGSEDRGDVWESWSGSVRCRPALREAPASDEEVASALGRAGARGLAVRVAGSGHSHTPLVATGGLLLSLERIAGVERCDPDARTATVRAGTVLRDLGGPLLRRGLAMENLGDVDVQALAGALATGTHGTGRALGSLPTQVEALRLVTAAGETLECSPEKHPEVFDAARVSLGVLGVVTAVRLRLLPAYRLHERIWREDVDPCLERLEERVAANRHFEFFWLPHRDRVELKTLNPTEAAPAQLPGRERIGEAAAILPSRREERFVEMEYALPAEAGPDCFREIRALLRGHHPDVLWPVEYRTVAADDIPLSPACGRDTVTLSLHQGAGLPYEACFADAEAILADHGGRPHWGKWHTLRADRLAPRYPGWERFRRARRALDPEGRFLTPYLRELLGEPT